MISSSSINLHLLALFGIVWANFRYNYHIGNVKFSCTEGWTLYGNSCYIVVPQELSWTEANNLCASQRYNYSRSIALHDWFLLRDMSTGLLNSTGNYWTAFYHRNSVGSVREDCRAPDAVLHAKYYSYTISIYNPLWSSHQPEAKYCAKNSCVYMHANFSDQTNYGWKMANCSVKYFTICETFACLTDYQYRCEDNSRCYPRKGRCDGIQECSDNSDETGCSEERAKCGKILFEKESDEINFEMSSAENAHCQWTIRQHVGRVIILTLIDVNIRESDELIINGIQNNTANIDRPSQLILNMPMAKTQYISINNTMTIIYRSQKLNGTIAATPHVTMKFAYITQRMYCFLPVIPYGSVVNITGFEIGSKLYFKCRLGYQTLFGQLASSYCYNGEWIPKPKCHNLNCGSASTVYNNAILTGYTRNITLYSQALYSCESGFYLTGNSPSFRLCTENGTWTNPDFSCQALPCYATSLAYGHFLHQSYANGTAGRYICDEGFYQEGTDPICISGTWKGIPNCYPKNYCYNNPCGHGTCVQLIGGYSCLCQKGFKMVSTSNGYICLDIDECSTPGYSLCEFICINTIGSYECKCPNTHRLYISPNDVHHLVSNAEFLIPNKTCIAKRCPVLEIPPNVIPYPLYMDPFPYQNGLYQIGTVVHFACDNFVRNYTSLVCDETESWIELNSCLDMTCTLPKIIKKNLMIWPIKNQYKLNDEIHFFCNKSYQLNGPSSSYCIGNNTWSLSKLPDCIVRKCPGLLLDDYRIILPTNKTVISEVNSETFHEPAMHIADIPGYSIFIMCKNGDKFANGQEKILLLCMQNYTWNLNSLPACIHEENVIKNQSYNTASMINRYTNKNCIRTAIRDVHVPVNSSVMLWCLLHFNCINLTSINGLSLRGENGSFGLFFENVKLVDNGRYYCAILDKNEEPLEKFPIDLYIYQTFETVHSWRNIVQSSEPNKEILFTSDNNNWSISSETVPVNNNSFFTGTKSSNKSWLFQHIVLMPLGCSLIEVKYQPMNCSTCILELISYSLKNIGISNYPSTNFNASNIDLIDHRLHFFQKEICLQRSSMFVGIRGDINSVVPNSIIVRIYAVKCPEIRVSFAIFPQTTAVKEGVTVSGRCVLGAHTIIPDQNPQLFCTRHGKWIYNAKTANRCFCSTNYTVQNDECMERGPICYTCSTSSETDCNDSSAVFCDTGQYCFTRIAKTVEGNPVVKGCSNECTLSSIGCSKTGEETCEMCCQADYCNSWLNMSKVHDEHLRPYPMFRAICPRNITVLRYSKGLFANAALKPPLIYNYEPFYHLTVNQNIFNDYWAPVLDCPPLFFDLFPNTTSPKCKLRLPHISYRDLGSNISISYDPLNGTIVEIGEPVKVTVTATDESNNSARCMFWYIGQVADCPLWPINETEYECEGSVNQRVCTRRQKCSGIEFPNHATSLQCTAGQGWSYVNSHSIAVVPMNLFRTPVCLKSFIDDVYLSINLAINSRLNKSCKEALIDKLHQLPRMHEDEGCRHLKWKFAGISIPNSLVFINYTVRHENISTAVDCAAQFTRQIIKGKLAFNALKTTCENIQFTALSANYSTACFKDQCMPGFYASENGCYPCPLHSFSETVGAVECISCPENTFTAKTGSFSSQLCQKQCPPGFFSSTGLEPCQACAIGFYQSHYGSQFCNSCFAPRTTAVVGSVLASECVLKCKPGWFSRTGFEPCLKCPNGFYQDLAGQTTCYKCIIDAKQKVAHNRCKGSFCNESSCENNGKCLDSQCICPSGYIGLDCSIALDLCTANFCPPDEECHFDGATTSCIRSNVSSLEARDQNPERRTKKKEATVSTENDILRSDCNQSFIQLDSGQTTSEITATAREENTLSPLTKFARAFAASSIITTTTNRWNNIESTSVASAVLATVSTVSTVPEIRCSNNFNFCKNGSCVATINGDINCTCRSGYKSNGNNSCALLQSCDYNPCGQNLCINDFNSEYFCECSNAHNTSDQQRWCPINEKCEHKKLCKNGGIPICNYKHHCICMTPYYGEYCTEKAQPCQNSPCNHSSCMAKFDQLWPYYFCKCDPGYYGEKCTAHAVCRSIDCKHGYCRQKGQTAYCECHPGFTGSDCSEEINHCNSSLCVNGICKPKFLGYTCICNEGYEGKQCEIPIDPCDLKPCAANSECHTLSYGSKGKFICNCAPGWTGKHCMEVVDLCIYSQCSSGSTCVTIPPTLSGNIKYVCICPPNKAGIFCNESVDYCQPLNPCLNEGICQRDNNDYTCHCKPGYHGDHCQYNLCSPNPCQNNGNCTVLSTGTYKCSCPIYYEGTNCSVITDACAISNFEDYCLNGGKCISNNFEPVCHCTQQYEGRRCENEKELDFNVLFNEHTRNLTSTSFDASILNQFTLCFWIRIVSAGNSFLDFVQQGFEMNILSITDYAVRFGKYMELTRMTENEWQQVKLLWHDFCLRRRKNKIVEWIRNGEIVWKRNWDIPVINGNLRILLGASESFRGEISMVQLYNTVLHNKQINESIHNCKQWLRSAVTSNEAPLVDWNQFTGFERGNRVFPGICMISECLLNPHHCNATTDKVPPQVINCPANINITSTERLTVVEWSPSKSNEIFADSSIINMSSNYNSGDVFTWGKYHVVYIAEDEAGNIETCQFDLVIAAMNCSDPEKIDGAKFTIPTVYSESVRKVAFFECETNFIPIQPVADFYFCDSMGQWSRWPHGINFYFPSCLKYVAPLQLLNGLVTITGNCTELEIYKKNLTSVILSANKQFDHFCATPNCRNELKIWSNSTCKNRFSRHLNNSAQNMRLYFSISVNTTRKSIKPVIVENLNKVFGSNTGKANTSWQCPFKNYTTQIFGSDTISCVECPPGMYCMNDKCVPCPENTFKKNPGCTQCIPCPNNTITGPIIGDIGYQSVFDCYTNCSAGYHYSIQEGSCVKCAKGMYQDRPGQLGCVSCPESHSTPKTGSVNISNCTVTCGAGMSMNAQSQCVKCAKGKYRLGNSTGSRCTPCPDHFTTSDNGSVSRSNCTVLDCPPGTYINLTSLTGCIFCPRNHYQEKSNQTECHHCGESLITLATGSVHPRQCMKPLFWNSVVSAVDVSKHFSSSLWPIFESLGLIGAIAFLVLLYFQRQRIRTLFCKVRKTQIKRIATLNYYRDSSFTYPIVTLTPTNTDTPSDPIEDRTPKNPEPQEMVEIYQEIYDGLHSMAEGTTRVSNDELTSSQFLRPLSRVRLEVDTTLKAEFCGDPKALGMDSSGLPIDSADYEKAEQCSLTDSHIYEKLQNSDEGSQASGQTNSHRQPDASRNWNSRISLDEIHAQLTEYKLSVSGMSDTSNEKQGNISHAENKDEESDDEDYFG